MKYRTFMRSVHVAAAMAIGLVLSFALSSCASKPEPLVEAGGEHLSLEIEDLTAELVARDRLQISGVFAVLNGSPHQWLLAAVDMRLSSDGFEVPLGQLQITRSKEIPGLSLPAASRERFGFTLECRVPLGDERVWELDLELFGALILEGNTRVERTTKARLEVPRVRDPKFSIEKVQIKQAELVNTRLILEVRIENPNPVELVFKNMEYSFYGDGRWWAESRHFNETTISAGSSSLVELELVMNFLNMKRSMLDQVIRMARIAYRLEGSATIQIPFEGFPPFVYPFALQGQSPVVR